MSRELISQDECLKNMSYWNTNDYLNLYIVNSICTSANGPNAQCGLTGYSYNSGAHGFSYDGPVLSRTTFTGTSEDAALVAHEVEALPESA